MGSNNWFKTKCKWCPKTYSQAGAYSNHLAKKHPEKALNRLKGPGSRKRRLSDEITSDTQDKDLNENVGTMQYMHEFSDAMLENEIDLDQIAGIMVPSHDFPDDDFSDARSDSEGSDREVREFESQAKEKDDGRLADAETQSRAGVPLRKHSFPEEAPTHNLYAPFQRPTDYRLARFFNAAKTSRAKIDQFFKDGILEGLGPTQPVQSRSAHTLYKLVDAASNEPIWHSGTVNYPLLKGVRFSYRNIISAVRYLLRQKVYAEYMVWAPQPEYDGQGDRVYSEINTVTWGEDTQVSQVGCETSNSLLIMKNRNTYQKEERSSPFS